MNFAYGTVERCLQAVVACWVVSWFLSWFISGMATLFILGLLISIPAAFFLSSMTVNGSRPLFF